MTLSPPQAWSRKQRSHWPGEEPLAFIDMETRQVVVNYHLLRKMEVPDSLTAVLAHEIGHHVRYPHTLGEAAALRALEQRLLPGLSQSLTNLFYDLLVNEHVGRTRADELMAVYRGFVKDGENLSALFGFYLAIYEALWQQPPGTLVPDEALARFEKRYPGFHADARLFAETFYTLATTRLQFVYFCCRFWRYIEAPEKVRFLIPLAGDLPAPGLDDMDEAVRGSILSEEAVEEARARGWLDDAEIDAGGDDVFTTIDRLTGHLPGKQQGAFRRILVGRLYKRLVDPHLLKLPGSTPDPEPSLPTALTDWEYGDNPKAIDWTGTVLQHGPLAGARPQRRELEPDDPPPPTEGDLPAIEIYLDTSGSMPNPERAVNAMTLAAQVLSASALRKNGLVRAVIYSSGAPKVSGWMRDETKAREFLLHYVGGGTQFPFEELAKHADERQDVIRVIVSDSDFLHNVSQKGAKKTMTEAAHRSRILVALLATSERDARKTLKPVFAEDRFRLAIVHDQRRFGAAAAALSRALFGE